MGQARSQPLPPYVPYRTFGNFLSELKSRGVPSRIDRSVMSHKSGTVQSQLLLTLNYLDLVKQSGKPTEKLERLVASEGAERKAILRRIMEHAYGFVFNGDFGIQTATSQQAEELFSRTGASGETLRRSIAFFLSACRDAGIPVSPYIKPHRNKKAARKAESNRESAGRDAEPPTAPPSEVESRRIRLKSGGTVTIEVAVNLFELDERDREFVFGLIDQLRRYGTEEHSA